MAFYVSGTQVVNNSGMVPASSVAFPSTVPTVVAISGPSYVQPYNGNYGYRIQFSSSTLQLF